MLPHVGLIICLIGICTSFPAQPDKPVDEEDVSIPENGSDEGLYNPDNHPDVFEGDILRTKPDLIKNAINSEEYLWPNAAVIYKIEDSVGCPYSQQCKILMQAMKHYERQTCVRFKEWTGETNYISVFFNPDSGSCWSAVGMIGGEQKVSLGQRCWYKGIVIHELGHAVGFWHEMNRPDRDDWIYIFWENILPSLRPAFNKHDLTQSNLLGENFDYKSIMMYDEYAFSKDGISPTFKQKPMKRLDPSGGKESSAMLILEELISSTNVKEQIKKQLSLLTLCAHLSNILVGSRI
ncbi:unnamed protein product [Bemisia tabaci]|uniref:Metalloendopeptidase n=1 Tax=Bemisia tabaci TaxID=7038 RepID=A0A9P0F025_BEMTA|nr:unnamed protein product [Bemisia tabaci]